MATKKNWIEDAIEKPGALRKTLKMKKDETIPTKLLEKAAKGGGKTAKRARLAITLKGMRHG